MHNVYSEKDYSLAFRLIDIDDFTGKLWQTHLSVKKDGYVQV